jgi:hypothetical protein
VAFLARPLAAYRVHAGSQSAVELGELRGPGYAFDPQVARRLRSLKLRFLEEHADRLGDTRALRRLVEQCAERETVMATTASTLDLGVSFRRLRFVATTARLDASCLVSPTMWRVLAADVLNGRRAAPQPARALHEEEALSR